MKRSGKKKWRRRVAVIAENLRSALEADYVVLGGGNAKLLKKLPPGCRLGSNATAFAGGYRLWDDPREKSKWNKEHHPAKAAKSN